MNIKITPRFNLPLTTCCLLLLTYFFLVPQTATAHILKSDENIGGVIHVDPNDEPVAKSQSSISFEIKDTANKFSYEKCNCIFSISQNEKEIYSTELPKDSTAQTTEYTFPTANSYRITLTGAPVDSQEFRPFTLEYDIRVSKEVTQKESTSVTNNNSHAYYALAFITLGVIIISIILKRKNK